MKNAQKQNEPCNYPFDSTTPIKSLFIRDGDAHFIDEENRR